MVESGEGLEHEGRERLDREPRELVRTTAKPATPLRMHILQAPLRMS